MMLSDVLLQIAIDLLNLLKADVKDIQSFKEIIEETEDKYCIRANRAYENFYEAFNSLKEFAVVADTDEADFGGYVNVEEVCNNLIYTFSNTTFEMTPKNKKMLEYILNLMNSLA